MSQLIGIEDELRNTPVQHAEAIATVFKIPPDLPERFIRILDITGKIVPLVELNPGIYFIEVIGEIKYKLVILQNYKL